MVNALSFDEWWQDEVEFGDDEDAAAKLIEKHDDIDFDEILEELLSFSEPNEQIIIENLSPNSNGNIVNPTEISTTLTDLNKEIRYHHVEAKSTIRQQKLSSSVKSFECEHCHVKFSHLYKIRQHMKTHELKEILRCQHCNKVFNQRNSLVLHVKSHANECNRSECKFCRDLLKHECNQCDQQFFNRQQLRQHKRIHDAEKSLQCEFCGKEFTLPRYLTIHKKVHTTSIKEIECNICSKKFNRVKAFKAHLICHSNERLFACDTCGTKFQRKNALNEHKKLHTNTKQYICENCGREFVQFAGLYTHMRQHDAE